MAKEFDNTNSGALFKNEEKEKDSQPDYRGQIDVEGTEYWLAAWIKKSKKGVTYMSLSVQPKEEARPAARGRDIEEGNRRARAVADTDDIPFDRPFRGLMVHVV